MKTIITLATAIALPLTALACSGAPATDGTTTEALIRQGGCSREELLQGYFESNGDCYGPTDNTGGGGAGGGGGQACFDRCNDRYDSCTNRCDQRGAHAQSTCGAACKQSFSRCANVCTR